MRYLLLAPILLAAACSTAPGAPTTQQTGKDMFAIPYGQGVVVPGSIFEVRFQAVLGDSRCPSDVVCIWAGEVKVELGLTLGDGPTVPAGLKVGETITHGGYTLALVEVDPYPVSTRPHVPEDYVVHLRVSAGVR